MRAKKSFGQNWLRDEYTLDLIVDSADINVASTVLEVGPGLGTLTQKLAKVAGKVVAVEADQDLIPGLLAQFAVKENVEVITGDILKYDLNTLAEDYKVVANIPYYLTAKLIRNLLGAANPPDCMVLLVQKEVAERIVAKPGHMSVLAVSVQYYATVNIVALVPKELFQPIPKVDSAIIKVERRPKPLFEADTSKLFRLVKAGFGEKRKMLRNSLSGGLGIATNEVEGLLAEVELPPTSRAQELSMQDWQKLYAAYNKTND